MQINWKERLLNWKTKFGCTVAPPVKEELLRKAFEKLGTFPRELIELFHYCNGIELNWFKIFPIENKYNIKDTWDGILRANNRETTRLLNRDEGLLSQFLIFAILDGGRCAVIKNSDNSIWYEENNELHETDLNLPDFIETCLRESKEL